MASAEAKDFVVPAPGKASWLTLLGLAAGLPALSAMLGWLGGSPDQALRILTWMLPLMLVTVGALALAMQRRSVTLQPGELVVRAAMYTQRLPLATLDIGHARVINLDERTELRPTLKTNGYSIVGFHAGHYRAGLKQRVFCLLTDRRRVLALPQHDGRVVLLSLERPHLLLDALREKVPSDPAHRPSAPARPARQNR
jgi:hypothetical protein